MTLRAQIDAIQVQALSGNLTPVTASLAALEASALLGNCLEEVRETEVAFHRLLLGYLDAGEPLNRAQIRAKTSAEYQRLREAQNLHAMLLEVYRGLKGYARAAGEEAALGR